MSKVVSGRPLSRIYFTNTCMLSNFTFTCVAFVQIHLTLPSALYARVQRVHKILYLYKSYATFSASSSASHSLTSSSSSSRILLSGVILFCCSWRCRYRRFCCLAVDNLFILATFSCGHKEIKGWGFFFVCCGLTSNSSILFSFQI